ncbi:hypothetical protein [Vibrio agarivorans]|uniref:Uncharacterized protein n=1 Tax=Vibrio agarivorans TaxID=153622 RepID=A0ABT7Y0D4_9VIBR|nr:hypothetical protein [Vibrio agarivorans]MDN2481497.1 hypothetical protein [Vibrio agarivorans]
MPSMVKSLLTLLLLLTSVMIAIWTIAATNNRVSHAIMTKVWDLPSEQIRFFEAVFGHRYLVFPVDHQIEKFDVLDKIAFWRDISMATSYVVVPLNGRQSGVYTDYVNSPNVPIYKDILDCYGVQDTEFGLEVRRVTIPEKEIDLIFYPAELPKHVVAF